MLSVIKGPSDVSEHFIFCSILSLFKNSISEHRSIILHDRINQTF